MQPRFAASEFGGDAGTAPIDLVASTAGVVIRIAADDRYVYWITDAPRALRAAPVAAPGATIDLATDLGLPQRLALSTRNAFT